MVPAKLTTASAVFECVIENTNQGNAMLYKLFPNVETSCPTSSVIKLRFRSKVDRLLLRLSDVLSIVASVILRGKTPRGIGLKARLSLRPKTEASVGLLVVVRGSGRVIQWH